LVDADQLGERVDYLGQRVTAGQVGGGGRRVAGHAVPGRYRHRMVAEQVLVVRVRVREDLPRPVERPPGVVEYRAGVIQRLGLDRIDGELLPQGVRQLREHRRGEAAQRARGRPDVRL